MADNETSNDEGHLADVPDGCGCAEMWEVLSEQRDRAADEDSE